MASRTWDTLTLSVSSFFIDQDLVLVDKGFYVLGKSLGADKVNLFLQELLKFHLVAKKLHPDGLAVIQLDQNVEVAALANRGFPCIRAKDISAANRAIHEVAL